MKSPYERIEQLTDVLSLLEDSRKGISVAEIARSLGVLHTTALAILNDLRSVFAEIVCEEHDGQDYFRLVGQEGTGAPALTPEIERIRMQGLRHLDGRDLDGPFWH